MIFGHTNDSITINIEDTPVEVVQTYKYLGVILDSNLDFSVHVDYAVSKAKKATAKICTLIDGRKGISIQLGLQLNKTLVRRAIPAWANISNKDLDKTERAQTQCLCHISGTKLHTSSAAVEVICGIIPMRFRIRQLCSRVNIRILAKEKDHEPA